MGSSPAISARPAASVTTAWARPIGSGMGTSPARAGTTRAPAAGLRSGVRTVSEACTGGPSEIRTGGSSGRTMRGRRRKATRAAWPIPLAAQTARGGGDRRATASAGSSSANRPSASLRPWTSIGGAPSPGPVREMYHSSIPARRPSSGGSASASQTSAFATGRSDSSTTTPVIGTGFVSADAGSWAGAVASAIKSKADAFMMTSPALARHAPPASTTNVDIEPNGSGREDQVGERARSTRPVKRPILGP